jgi:lysophospholipase L1-like esterase
VAANFLKFSPLMLQLRLLPSWVFISLAANGLLLAALLGLSMRRMSSTTLVSASSTSNLNVNVSSTAATAQPTTAQANLTTLTPPQQQSGPRPSLTYQQWQALLEQEAEAVVEQQPDHLTILAGDSISLWFPEALLSGDRTWLNQSISGETSAGLLKRLNAFEQTEPETIFIMIGINDLLRGFDEQTILDNQQQLIRTLKETHPQAQIVIQSVLPHASDAATWEGRDRLLKLPNARIQQLNRELEAIAQNEEVFFLDLQPLFADEQGNLRMELSTDGLHLNNQGYQTWSIALKVYSREVLEAAIALNE